MNHVQVWQSVLDQLQMEMPRASFDTWVRDTRALDLEDGLLTIGVGNEYARDWLDSRLTSTVNRLLLGILNMDAQVRFVVTSAAQPVVADADRVFDGGGENGGDEGAEVRTEKLLTITAAEYASVYERLVRPDQAITINGYLREWATAIGPELTWMYLAFRQAAYSAGARAGQTVERINAQAVIELCGISPRTFWYRVGGDAIKKLAGLVDLPEQEKEWQDGTPHRLPLQYHVAMTLPLTPAHTHSLRTWLQAHIVNADGGPSGVIGAALQTDRAKLLSGAGEEAARTVPALLTEVFPEMDLFEREGLAAALQNHLMPPGDLIVISLFFMRNILPHLKAGLAWILTLLRDRCYVDPRTGEYRNRVCINGGYEELAAAAGLEGSRRARTIYDWLRDPIAQVYIRQETDQPSAFIDGPRIFSVLLEEIPHEVLLACLTGLPLAIDANCSIGLTRFAVAVDANCSIALTRFAVAIDASCRVFKSLKLLKPNSKACDEFSSASNPASREKAEGAEAWDFSGILKRAVGNNQKRAQLARTTNARLFVAWMLYALASSRLGDPLGFTISKLIDDPEMVPPRRFFIQLAGWSPADLRRHLERGEVPSGYQDVFGRQVLGTRTCDRDKLSAVFSVLFDEDLPNTAEGGEEDDE